MTNFTLILVAVGLTYVQASNALFGPGKSDVGKIEISFSKRQGQSYEFKAKNNSNYLVNKIEFLVVGKVPGRSSIWATKVVSKNSSDNGDLCTDDTILKPGDTATVICNLNWSNSEMENKKLNIEAWIQEVEFDEKTVNLND